MEVPLCLLLCLFGFDFAGVVLPDPLSRDRRRQEDRGNPERCSELHYRPGQFRTLIFRAGGNFSTGLTMRHFAISPLKTFVVDR
jgi:hypothetical protein